MSLSSKTSVHPNDGHIEGYLNCIAIRHGWTRTFSISPSELSNLDYTALERILELPTLKLRAVRLRIFVENPVESGLFSKVRFWKDDGSLQSTLIKDFFEMRRVEGAIMRFEVRDGRARIGGVAEEDGHATPAGESVESEGTTNTRLHKKRSITFDWFTKHRRGPATAPEPESEKTPSATRRIIAFFVSVVATRPVPMYNPLEDPGALPAAPPAENEDTHEDEHELRLARRKSQLKARIASANSTSPFFSASTTRISARTRPQKPFSSDSGVSLDSSPCKPKPDVPEDAESDGEIIDVDDLAREFEKKASSSAFDLFRPFMTRAKSAPSVPIRKLKRSPKKERERPVVRDDPRRFKGAVVIRRPEEAFPKRIDTPLEDERRPMSANLLDDDDDPFRG